jgi:predicted dehydrogenase
VKKPLEWNWNHSDCNLIMNRTESNPSRTESRCFLRAGSQSVSGRLSRRDALKLVAAGGVFTVVPRHVLGGAGHTAPSGRPALAGIGIGGVGFPQLEGCEAAGFHVTALCDIDDVYARKAYDRWPKARRYRDFREMLRSEGDRIDAVYCGTPDHTHAIIVLPALRRKKHVCCVKPLTRTIEECRVVVRAAEEAGVATQVTSEPNTNEAACRTCELIWGGAIGPVREAHLWSDRPWWPHAMERPGGSDPVPRTLDWEAWIGPARMRPYVAEWPKGHLALRSVKTKVGPDAVYHPWNFRGWWDFGTGALGDMGCHHINTPARALKLTYPTEIQASATKVFAETAPLASIVTYDYPARDDMPPLRLFWYDGGLRPPSPPGFEGGVLPPSGEMYIGDDGIMLGHRILTEKRRDMASGIPRSLPRRPGIWGEWFEACQGGELAGCDFGWSGPATEFVLLGNLAIRSGKRLEYDAQAMRITNDEAANALIREPYHNGWTLG